MFLLHRVLHNDPQSWLVIFPSARNSVHRKLITINNLNNLIPFKLDVDKMNYSSWVYFFKNLCKSYFLLDHILGNGDTSSSTTTPPYDKWLKIDTINHSWIIITLYKTLQQCLVIKDPQTAKIEWDLLADIFQDNKRTHSIALKAK